MKKNLLYAFAAGSVLLGASATAAVYSAQESKAADTVTIAGFVPATGSEVKSISTVTVRFEVGEVMYNSDDSKVAEITLTKQGSSESVSATSFGEPTMTMDEMYFEYPVNFATPVTEAGTYTLSIPEGIFFETEYDATKDAFVKKEGGIVNAAATATYVVNPETQAKSVFDNYTLTPADGTETNSLSGIKILFNDLTYMSNVYNSTDGIDITISNGKTTYTGFAQQDWGYEEENGKMFNVTFTDSEYEPIDEITEDGEWILMFPQGAFQLGEDKSPEITAKYLVGNSSVVTPSEEPIRIWNTFPVSDWSINSLSFVNLMLPTPDNGAQFTIDPEKFAGIVVCKDDKPVEVTLEVGEALPIMDEMIISIPLLFDKKFTEEGEYSITLPAGLIYESKYDQTKDDMVKFNGYRESAPAKYYFTVSAETEPFLSEYEVFPAINQTVSSLDDIHITFPQVPYYINVSVSYMDEITITDGKDTYTAIAKDGQDGMNKAFYLEFYDNNSSKVKLTGGKWNLMIPEGYFTLGDSKNPKIESEYALVPYELTPAPGSTLTELKDFFLSFPEAKTVKYVGSDYMFTLTQGQASGIPSMNVTEVADATVPTFKLSVPEDTDAAIGTISLNIEEGAFLIDPAAGETEGNSPWIQANYRYNRPISNEVQYEPSTPNVLCQNGYTVGFVFDPSCTPSFTSNSDWSNVEIKFDGTPLRIGSENQAYSGQADCAYSIMENIISFYIINPDFHKAGTISVSMKGEAYRLSGEPGFDVSHTWNVVMPKTYSFTLNPDGGVDSASAVSVYDLSKITLSIPEAASSEVFMESGVSLRASDYSYYGTAKIAKSENAADACEYTFTFDPAPTTKGIYQLSIRFDTFTLDGSQGWPSDWTNIDRFYKFDKGTGISDINAENGNVTVVSVDGKVILKDAPASELKNLAKGIYIINGKKQIIK